MEKYIVFDGKGSNVTSWFRKEKIVAFSWSTIAHKTYHYFSLEGDMKRQFLIINFYEHCMKDRVFMVVISGNEGHGCAYDTQASYPQFLFATGDDHGAPE
ncbi:hypothetical protein DPMN_107887 [Dreissena polymorpha]|uniref:Uncharacterized protein n=1 Tax=Dreissena polymorpha TaxID=45954 RepID=A0A9D4QLH0_DREPO|nr:hypothetical protein DPMN_107887 [Dreissena polymorpha]